MQGAVPSTPIELSFVIPVYNGGNTIADVVRRVHAKYGHLALEVILVNDGSADHSESACRELCKEFPATVSFLNLARNFGEHNAVLAGLTQSQGAYVAVLDDDGQNPPEEVEPMYQSLLREDWDVVYGRFKIKRHSWFRNLGSRFNDALANVMLKKPPGLYLSSFKVMSRFVVNEVLRYKGSFPYIDGLILRTTRNIGQVDVEHRANQEARSNYTLMKLVRLWANMFLNFSILPLRAAVVIGLTSSVISAFLLVLIVVDKLFITPRITHGIPTVLATVVLFAGVQLTMLGLIGEYLGRLFLDYSQTPQFVVRDLVRPSAPNPAPASKQP